ncbi:hypothetical protein V1520DRAFT_179975 [Lipomyces starkeyi]|uniref:Uncharacterized protein n=1 Tax=Lipomyces starkeyi NRRL Y-11557 TaxID=675824 RepID=A0A1E3Q0B4_LIPST|nr:hypothetical protein LIPSTDRAFT_73724 [Lipomyces starkeyi NRRL Y-11557]
MTTVISQASRYRANLALFDAHLVRERQETQVARTIDFLHRQQQQQQQLQHTNAYAAAVHASRIGACTANTSTLLHTASTAPRLASPDAESKSMGEGAGASNSLRRRRRRRRRTLHNHRFSDRSESEAGSETDEDSDLEMERRGRPLTRLGDESNDTSCASSSRVLSSTRGVRSDDEDRMFEDSSDDDEDQVRREVEDFKKLLAQAQQQDCFCANMPDEMGTALTCDDEESEDDEYDSESVDDKDDDDDGDDFYSCPRRESLGKYDFDDEDYYDEDIRSEGTRGSSSSALSGTSLKSLKNRYTVTDFSVDNDPGRVVRVDKFMISRDIVPDAVVKQ